MDQVANGTDVGVLETVVRTDRQFQLINRTIELIVAWQRRTLHLRVSKVVRIFFEVDEDRHVILDQLRRESNRVFRFHRPIGPNFDGEFVKLGVLTETGCFNVVIDFFNWGVDRVDRDVTEREVLVKVSIRGNITTTALQAHFNFQRTTFTDGRDMYSRIEDLDVSIGFDISRRDFARFFL